MRVWKSRILAHKACSLFSDEIRVDNVASITCELTFEQSNLTVHQLARRNKSLRCFFFQLAMKVGREMHGTFKGYEKMFVLVP